MEKFAESIAVNMNATLNDEGYQKIFAKQSEEKIEKVATTSPATILNELLTISETLDSLGFHKSSVAVLKVASDLVDESEKEEELEVSEDENQAGGPGEQC